MSWTSFLLPCKADKRTLGNTKYIMQCIEYYREKAPNYTETKNIRCEYLHLQGKSTFNYLPHQ